MSGHVGDGREDRGGCTTMLGSVVGSDGWSTGAPVPLFKEFLHLSIPSKPRLLVKTGIHLLKQSIVPPQE